jgi:chlorite dismutase
MRPLVLSPVPHKQALVAHTSNSSIEGGVGLGDQEFIVTLDYRVNEKPAWDI